jgi:hypothetical protein
MPSINNAPAQYDNSKKKVMTPKSKEQQQQQQREQLVLSGQPFRLFIESCRTAKTKETYTYSLKSYMALDTFIQQTWTEGNSFNTTARYLILLRDRFFLFYRPPSLFMTERSASVTPDNFRFSAKFPRPITHEKRLAGPERQLRYFFDVMRPLRSKVLALLLQLPPSLTAKEASKN